MSLPKTILDILKVIHEKIEITSENNELISIAIWDFSDSGKISKTDIRNGLRKLAEDEKLFDLEDAVSLYLQEWIPGEEIKIRVNRERFEEFYKKHLQEQKTPTGRVKFLDEEAALKLGDKKCALPPYKNEHFFCRAAFEHQINEPIDWSIVYEKMTGYYEEHFGKSKDTRENWHRVYDTMEAINKRAKETLGIEKLFIWQEKTIKRTR